MKKIIRFFNESNQFWSDNRDYNRVILESKLMYCKTLFEIRGFLLLKEFYDEFGLAVTKESLTYGWTNSKSKSIDVVLLPEIGTTNVMILIECYDITDYFPDKEEA